MSKEIEFGAAFPQKRQAVKFTPNEACILSLDAFLLPEQVAELLEIVNSEEPLVVSIRTEPENFGAGTGPEAA